MGSLSHRCNGSNDAWYVSSATTTTSTPAAWPTCLRPHAFTGCTSHAGTAGWTTTQSSGTAATPTTASPTATSPAASSTLSAGTATTLQSIRPDGSTSWLEPDAYRDTPASSCPRRPCLEEAPTPRPNSSTATIACYSSDS